MRVCGVGDNVVDRYPDLGVVFPGGGACNVAVHAGRLGADAAYLDSIGGDAAGDLVRHSLASEGVGIRWSRYGRRDEPQRVLRGRHAARRQAGGARRPRTQRSR
ncbi:hypothetical protein GCM10010517_60520 [Streptosporangium fragile]|uniref:Carbohydrate kinase PfkB domain-containing protein n=1 Tax=Streptosporangium fragile TaxID=46186 RepID=A0ABN3W6R8_9ACTN